ncbi:inhibitor of the pro-sigma K processing machinery [Scopulibacillus darangshiensis]|uniref:Inhibitor of the pro-sigma K processing machinery n=1 Tax=Scopulibacillus darangshiensis TaxID=442528 RepID=A0A4R2NLG4_9BACL|nr:pro-sigmaK processing inhibitor BofA family protein [Scopulibacillus darangshiensis]TCP22115.1 inhibitor of the pro-sigma K processing machinery [Scopulibacillus darangshiensis]
MDPVILISIFVGMGLILLFIGAPLKPMRFAGKVVVKLLIGALMLFLLNTFGTSFNIHVPINAITTCVSGLLGIPGVAALVVIRYFILP